MSGAPAPASAASPGGTLPGRARLALRRYLKRLALCLPPLRRLVESRDRAKAALSATLGELEAARAALADLERDRAAIEAVHAELVRTQNERDRYRADLESIRVACGFPPGHYYSPIPDVEDIRARAGRIFDREGDPCAGIDLNAEAQFELARELARYASDLPLGAAPPPGLRYFAENDFYAAGDGTWLYGMLRHLRPARVVEIGSGFTSALILDVNERHFDNRMACTFIEPDPERLNRLLKPGDAGRVEIRCERVQNTPPEVFAGLESGDFLIVDSTHVSKIGSDVNHILFRILPSLPSGVLVHFHDAFFPFEYPEKWFDEHRFWNELYILRAFLQYNHAFEVVLFTDFLKRRYRSWIEENVPQCLGGAQLWIRRR